MHRTATRLRPLILPLLEDFGRCLGLHADNFQVDQPSDKRDVVAYFGRPSSGNSL